MPLQRDIASAMFMGLYTSSPQVEAPGWFVGPGGLRHTNALAAFMREKFNIPPAAYSAPSGRSELDFWNVLQERGYTLETLYAAIEAENDRGQYQVILEDFAAIVRTIIRDPNQDRDAGKVCRHHRALAEALEPGDYIVNFNWDCLMADALLFYCPFWFPWPTGFGVRVHGAGMVGPPPKKLPIDSDVQLFHVHGCIALFESEPLPGRRKRILYAGPKYDSSGPTFAALVGISAAAPGTHGSFNLSQEDERRVALGHIRVGEGDDQTWFRPIFVPPSKDKQLEAGTYPAVNRALIHSRLPLTQRLLIAGYSFPDADTEHVRRLFPEQIIDSRLEITVVNPASNDDAFRGRVEAVFPPRLRKNFDVKDFREFCRGLMAEGSPIDDATGQSTT